MRSAPVLVLLLLSSACGADAVVANSTAAGAEQEPTAAVAEPAESSPPSATLLGGDLDIILAPDKDGNLPADLWIGCETGPEFQVADLNSIVPLSEGDPGGVADAISSFLLGGEGQFWPQEGWSILRETQNEILLVHAQAGVSFMTVRRAAGQWAWSGAQAKTSCPLHYLVPDGLNAVDWRVDPETSPAESSTVLNVVLSERNCVGGQELGDRLRGPQVVLTDDALRLAFAAVPPPGTGFNCPGNPERAFTVELPEPLGAREIFEGLAIGADLEDYLP